VTVRFKAVGSAPILKQQVCRINATQRFEAVVAYLRRVLKCGPQDSVFLYVNSTFAPALDEIVGNLHRVSGSLLKSQGEDDDMSDLMWTGEADNPGAVGKERLQGG